MAGNYVDDDIKAPCEGQPCQMTFVRARWRRRKKRPVEPSAANVTVTAVKPVGALVGMGARLGAVERIEEALNAENKVIGGKCPGECACVAETPEDDEFSYTSWTITVDFHLGGRDPRDQSDRIDYRATFKAMRAEVTVDGECQIQRA